MKPPQFPGFTLIELLVVIAIIGVLSALGLVALTGSQAKARDAKRRTDLQSVGITLAGTYLDTHAHFPINDPAVGTSPGWGPIWLGETDSRLHEASTTATGAYNGFALPKSPNQGGTGTANDYWYVSDAAGETFALWTKLEADPGDWYVFNSKGFADVVLGSNAITVPPDRSPNTECLPAYGGKTFSPCLGNPRIE